jgi:hypothetical protein
MLVPTAAGDAKQLATMYISGTIEQTSMRTPTAKRVEKVPSVHYHVFSPSGTSEQTSMLMPSG